MTGAGPIRVLIADDHPVVRRGMAALLDSVPGFEVVAEATSGIEAIKEAQLSRPDVVLMDIRMPELDGVGATTRIAAALPEVAVLVVTMFDDDETVLSAMRAGARGYLLKGAGPDEIVAAIRSVVAGQLVVGPGVARQLLALLAHPPVVEVAFPALTPREREILDLIAQGRGNAAIAATLHVADKTVSNNVSAIFAKLRVSTRAEAIVQARERGLGAAGVVERPGRSEPRQ